MIEFRSRRPVHDGVILFVKDDLGGPKLTRRAWASEIIRADLCIVHDDREALEHLPQLRVYADPQSPLTADLSVTDRDRRRIGGRQVLKQLRQHPSLNRMPVAAPTTPDEERNILRTCELGCNSFVSQPLEIRPSLKVVRGRAHY